jgi:hypothetical protein
MRRHWLIYRILLLYINRSSLSSTNKEMFRLFYAAWFYFPIRISESDSLFMGNKKKGGLFLFFPLFLSLTLLWFIKNALLYSQFKWEQLPRIIVRQAFESIYRHLYLLVITFNRTLSLSMVLRFYMWQQWKWKPTGILSFLQKKAKEHRVSDYRYGLEQVYSLQKVRTIKLIFWMSFF